MNRASASAVSSSLPRDVADRAPLRVVLIEDSPLIRARLLEALAEIDAVVVAGQAEDEAEALALLDRTAWDVVLVDLQLRQGNGLRIVKVLGPRSRRDGHVVVLTNYAFPQYRERSLALGADHFFDKAREMDRALALVARLARGAPLAS